MNLLRVAGAIVIAIILFIVIGHVVSFIMGAITFIVVLALVAGGGYIAYKVVSGDRRREIRRGDRY